jgi:hypothetical protein
MTTPLDTLRDAWRARWPEALAAWSRFVQLSEPRWCLTAAEEKAEHLSGSFAMIRLVDHAVVISLRQVAEHGLEDFATEVLAHEIGHHVYCPADLTDDARMLARMRVALPGHEPRAPMVANLYGDLLINDRLQRGNDLNLAGVYLKLGERAGGGPPGRLWTFYMRVYELLWKMDRGSLAVGAVDQRLNTDAQLGARLIRSYAKDWLDGSGRFAALCFPYLAEDESKETKRMLAAWCDAADCGAGGFPDGLAEIDDGELEGAVHPASDPDLSGVEIDGASSAGVGRGRAHGNTGVKTQKRYRGPVEYAEVLRASGVKLDDREIVVRYYRERAVPLLVRFPSRVVPQSTDPLPEGLDTWDAGQPLEDVDWLATVLASPHVVPGVTTRQRVYGTSPGTTPDRQPIDLYLGVDCSGSMGNPATQQSYPVLAGAIIALSALRAGSRVMVALSGEPGKTVTTDGFVRDEQTVLRALTDYLGTGTTFGIHRLRATFDGRKKSDRPVHVLIVTDNDIFGMLDSTEHGALGWDVARDSLAAARGGGTYVLQLPAYLQTRGYDKDVLHPGQQRMQADGWAVANVDSMDGLVAFARRFSQANYGQR